MFGREIFLSRIVLYRLTVHVTYFHLLFPSIHKPSLWTKTQMPSQTILAPQAILPGDLSPQPATIVFDTDSGTITSVTLGIHQPEHGKADVWEIEDGKVLLPGLIEYVYSSSYPRSHLTAPTST